MVTTVGEPLYCIVLTGCLYVWFMVDVVSGQIEWNSK